MSTKRVISSIFLLIISLFLFSRSLLFIFLVILFLITIFEWVKISKNNLIIQLSGLFFY